MKLAIAMCALPMMIGCSSGFKKTTVVNMTEKIDPTGGDNKTQLVCQRPTTTDPGELPYFYEGAAVAVCLPAEVVQFTVCAERLGLAETSGSRSDTKSGDMNIDLPQVAAVGAAGKHEQSAEVTTKFVTEDGDLGKARADALRGCLTFLGKEATDAAVNLRPK